MTQLVDCKPATAPAPARALTLVRSACRVAVLVASWLASQRRVVVPLVAVLAMVVAIVVTGLVAVGWLIVAAAVAIEALMVGARR